MNLIKDFAGLFFPDVCHSCGNSLYQNEKVLCTRCSLHMPETNFHSDPDNPVARVFWGRVRVRAATALFFYKKGGAVQQLIHQLKYRGQKEIGIHLGKLLGSEIKHQPSFDGIDCIVPIPLHRKKKKMRGFNQAELIGLGVSQALEIPMNVKTVIRQIASDTQTRKGRYNRWENVSEIFLVKDDTALQDKHVLVVDDVITTGATMEACLQALSRVPGITLSVACIAFASR
jgi:ComF family protein